MTGEAKSTKVRVEKCPMDEDVFLGSLKGYSEFGGDHGGERLCKIMYASGIHHYFFSTGLSTVLLSQWT